MDYCVDCGATEGTTHEPLVWVTLPDDHEHASRDYVVALPVPFMVTGSYEPEPATHIHRWFNRAERSWVVTFATILDASHGDLAGVAGQVGSSTYVATRDEAEAEASRLWVRATTPAQAEPTPEEQAQAHADYVLALADRAQAIAEDKEASLAFLQADRLPSVPVDMTQARAIVAYDLTKGLNADLMMGGYSCDCDEDADPACGDCWVGVQGSDEVEDMTYAPFALVGTDAQRIYDALAPHALDLECESETYCHEQASDEQAAMLDASGSNICSGCLQYDLVPRDEERAHLSGAHVEESLPGCDYCRTTHDPEPCQCPNGPHAGGFASPGCAYAPEPITVPASEVMVGDLIHDGTYRVTDVRVLSVSTAIDALRVDGPADGGITQWVPYSVETMTIQRPETSIEPEETPVSTITLNPEWPQVARFMAVNFATQGFERNAFGPMASFLETIGHLAQADPQAVKDIVAEMRRREG
jgi:hypothetical protein